MRILGMLSGTSHDGIDTAVVDFELDGETLVGTVIDTGSTPYDPALRKALVAALPPASLDFGVACRLDTLIGQAFAEVAAATIARSGPVDWICSHGQTVFHWVEGTHARGTLQIGQPAWIAERTGVPVVADVRVRDVTVGGHGAPLVSLMDTLLLAGLPGRPAALNLGGIANMTVLHGQTGPFAYDLGPANALIDAAIVAATGGAQDHDHDGRVAASGRVDPGLLEDLLAEPYYRLPPPKSTGKELFNGAYLDTAVARHPGIPAADLVATVTALTAEVVASEARAHGVDMIVASGGGCRNPTLMAMLRERAAGIEIRLTSEFGAPTDAKEAIAFALIAWHTVHGLAAIVPSCTGARQAGVLGAIVPGRDPLRLPAPEPAAPLALRLRPGPTSA